MHLASTYRGFCGSRTPLDHHALFLWDVHRCNSDLAGLFSMHFDFGQRFSPLFIIGLACTLCFRSGFYPVWLTYVGCLFAKRCGCSLVLIWFLWDGLYHGTLFNLSIIAGFMITSVFIHYWCILLCYLYLFIGWISFLTILHLVLRYLALQWTTIEAILEATIVEEFYEWCADDVVWCPHVLHKRDTSWHFFG